jgi:hypothetical protein
MPASDHCFKMGSPDGYGQVTLHLESFAQQHAKPTRAIGLRHDLLPQLQVDASWGRQAGQTLTTAGLKWMF